MLACTASFQRPRTMRALCETRCLASCSPAPPGVPSTSERLSRGRATASMCSHSSGVRNSCTVAAIWRPSSHASRERALWPSGDASHAPGAAESAAESCRCRRMSWRA
eukprot:6546844-Prymnesium_polylepis.1